jgi:hypothetical protein
MMTKTTERPNMRESARESYYRGSGHNAPSPTDEEIVAIMRRHMPGVIGSDAFPEPEATYALTLAAHDIRALFPTKTKD